MDLVKKILENDYGITLVKKGSTILFGVLGTAMLSRYLGPELKGEYTYTINMISILLVILNLGIAHVYPKFKREGDRDYASTFYLLSIAQFISYCIIGGITLLFINDIGLICIILLAPLCVLAFQLNYINLIEDVKISSIISIISSTINLILIGILFLLSPRQIIGAYIIYAIKEIVIIILTLVLGRVRFTKKDFDLRLWKRVIVIGFIPMVTTLMISINYKLDVIILDILNVDFYAIGLYATGISLAQYAWILPDVFKDVMMNRNSRKDDIEGLSFSMRIGSTIVLLFFIGFILIGKYAIYILFGSEFKEAYGVTSIIFFGVYSMLYCKILGTLYISQGKWRFYSYTLLGSVLTNVIFNFILIPKYGIYGAAISSVVSYTFAGMIFLIDFKRKYKIQIRNLILINKSDINKIKNFIAPTE